MILAIDTCLTACQAAVGEGGRARAVRSEPMARGHQERLAGLVQEVMTEAEIPFASLERIAVTVGPGSFTGLRVGLAFAKGLALATGRPVVGVGSLEALAFGLGDAVAAVIDAGRGNLYLQLFQDDAALTAPDVLPVDEVAARLADVLQHRPFRLTGPGADLLANALPEARTAPRAWAPPEALLALGSVAPLSPAQPLYLRPADAKPKAPRAAFAWT